MTNTELINFIKHFNASKPFDLKKVVLAAEKLSAKDHELLVLLINYKNSADFEKKFKKGEI